MILQTAQDIIGVSHCLLLAHYANVFSYARLNQLDLLLLLSHKRLT